MNKTSKKYVVVFDTHRGIYFGRLARTFNEGRSVVLEGFRHCYYYASTPEARGNFGLATHGPGSGSKIGPPVPKVTVHDVSKVCECTAQAVKRFEVATWGG